MVQTPDGDPVAGSPFSSVDVNLQTVKGSGTFTILALRQAEFLQNGKRLPNQVTRIIKTRLKNIGMCL